MNKLLVLMALLPLTSLAAPTGHMSCKTRAYGKNVEVIYGIYAVTGDFEIKINGEASSLAGDVQWIRAQSANDNSRTVGAIYSAKNEETGSFVQVTESSNKNNATYLLTVDTDRVAFLNKPVVCNVLDSKQGDEQN